MLPSRLMTSRTEVIRYHEGNGICPGSLECLGEVDPHLVVGIVKIDSVAPCLIHQVVATHC